MRHFYASVLLDAGENIKALAEYLGHSDPGLTLRVYAHLMPSSQEHPWSRYSACLPEPGRGCRICGCPGWSAETRVVGRELSGTGRAW